MPHFDRFRQTNANATCRGRPFTYAQKSLIVFLINMVIRRITAFKAQHQWLEAHRKDAQRRGLQSIPHHATPSRRFKVISPTFQAFVAFVGWWAEDLHVAFSSQALIENVSTFKAHGHFWHQSDREANRIPSGMRNRDLGAIWGKSAPHSWVFGYGLHLTRNRGGSPRLVQTETAYVDESQVLEQKGPILLRF